MKSTKPNSISEPGIPFYPQRTHIDIPDWSLMTEKKKILLFNAVLQHYREPGPLQPIVPRFVIPDTTNRGNTGLSVEHAHWVASKMQKEGFAPRTGTGPRATGHDLPIVVRESTYTEFGPESLLKWQRQVESEPGFAPIRLHTTSAATPPTSGGDGEEEEDDCIEFFGSLGNGHFFQALNLFFAEHPSLWAAGQRYRIGGDAKLRKAVEHGVPGVVLRCVHGVHEEHVIPLLA